MSSPKEHDNHGTQNEESSLLIPEEFGATTRNDESAFWTQSVPYRKLALASLASISLFTLGMLDVELLRNKQTKVENQATGLAKDSYDALVDFHSGKPIETKMVLDGNIDVLVNENLAMNCDKKAMTGFNMVNYKDVYAAYKYTCDTGTTFTTQPSYPVWPAFNLIEPILFTGANALENMNDRITDNTVEPGSGVQELSQFTVDCEKTGLNYVLSYLYLDANTKSGKYQYEYGCGTYETSVLDCSVFYTDLATETDVDDSVLHLADHPVHCYDGSALQSVQYERISGEVRYKYKCCSKNLIPTPSPTPLPTEMPVGDPTFEPTFEPSSEPVADPTLEPSQEPSLEPTIAPTFPNPTEMPTYEPTVEPSKAPVADATDAPVSDPTEAPIPDETEMPSLEPVAEPTMEPTAESTDAPIVAPTSSPTTAVSEADALLVESKHFPRYCPFTYLAGMSKVQSLPGCTFITRDQIIYMRDEETSPSLYVCTSYEDGEEIITHEDMVRYGLLIDGKGTVSDVRVGKDTKLEVTDKEGNVLFTVTPEDQRLVHIRQIDEAKIWGAKLTTTTSAGDVGIPDDCDDSSKAVSEASVGNPEKDKDEDAAEIGEDHDYSDIAGASVPESAEPEGSPAGQSAAQLHGIGEFKEGYLTRYWDCCKPSCGWSGKSPYGSIPSCAADGKTVVDIGDKSSCEGGTAYTCYDQAPWVSSKDPNLAFGFVAAPAYVPESETCGSCFEIDFTGVGHYWEDPGSVLLKGKKLIVQSTNIGHDVEGGQFDLLIPGGGVGAFNGCSKQWKLEDLGKRYGGYFSECEGELADKKLALAAKCKGLPVGLRAGCLWFNSWFEAADNPNMKFRPIECPQEIIQKTGFGAPPVNMPDER